MTLNTPHIAPDGMVETVAAAAIAQNEYELVRNLGRVLGIHAGQQMLLLAGDTALQQVLSDEFGCDVTLFDGDMQHLPYDARFDSVIVARPLTSALLPVTRELARVVKLHGTLGMIVLHAHADYAIETMQGAEHIGLLGTLVRPAAAYRAVLAESGFTAFVSTPRRAEVLRNVREAYRQHLLQPIKSHEQAAVDVPAQALRVLANEGIGVTLITAEKAL